jgi:hypothetical protein
MGKKFQKGKSFASCFPSRLLDATVSWPNSARETGPLSHMCLSHWQPGPTCWTFFPQILPGNALNGVAIASPAAAPSTRHHPRVAWMFTCAPAKLSRHIGCGAMWRHITATHQHCCRHRCTSRVPTLTAWRRCPRTVCSTGQVATAERTLPRLLHRPTARAPS